MYIVDVYRGSGKILTSFHQINDYIVYDDKLILTRCNKDGEVIENITLKFDYFSSVNIVSDDYHLIRYEGKYQGE